MAFQWAKQNFYNNIWFIALVVKKREKEKKIIKTDRTGLKYVHHKSIINRSLLLSDGNKEVLKIQLINI